MGGVGGWHRCVSTLFLSFFGRNVLGSRTPALSLCDKTRRDWVGLVGGSCLTKNWNTHEIASSVGQLTFLKGARKLFSLFYGHPYNFRVWLQ